MNEPVSRPDRLLDRSSLVHSDVRLATGISSVTKNKREKRPVDCLLSKQRKTKVRRLSWKEVGIIVRDVLFQSTSDSYLGMSIYLWMQGNALGKHEEDRNANSRSSSLSHLWLTGWFSGDWPRDRVQFLLMERRLHCSVDADKVHPSSTVRDWLCDVFDPKKLKREKRWIPSPCFDSLRTLRSIRCGSRSTGHGRRGRRSGSMLISSIFGYLSNNRWQI